MYCFLKKDGTIKKNYKEACQYIETAEVKEHEISRGRSDEIVKKYNCYTTKEQKFSKPIRDKILLKIVNICSDFNCEIKVWYSGLNYISIELHGERVEFMLNEIKKYLQ